MRSSWNAAGRMKQDVRNLPAVADRRQARLASVRLLADGPVHFRQIVGCMHCGAGRVAVRRARETACLLARRIAETSCSRFACAGSLASNENEEGAMAVVAIRWGTILAAVAALHVSCNVRAEDSPTYKCVYKGRVVYTQIRCGDAKPMGNRGKPRVNVRYEAPSQDRAVAAKRARLSEADRHACAGLDRKLREQETEFKAKGDAATLDDEMPLVRSKKQFRELKC